MFDTLFAIVGLYYFSARIFWEEIVIPSIIYVRERRARKRSKRKSKRRKTTGPPGD